MITSSKQREHILKLKEEGRGVSDIARKLNCSRFKVYYHLNPELRRKQAEKFPDGLVGGILKAKYQSGKMSKDLKELIILLSKDIQKNM